MDTLKLLKRLKHEHDFYNRWLTVALGALVCLAGFILWQAGVPLLDQYKSVVGLVLMFLAFVFYNIPYLAYRLMRNRYRNDAEISKLMGRRWHLYKNRIMKR